MPQCEHALHGDDLRKNVDFCVHTEICEDLWAPIPPSTYAALRGLAVLDTPADERFDRVTRIGAAALDVPIAEQLAAKVRRVASLLRPHLPAGQTVASAMPPGTPLHFRTRIL